jgi:uncharacterized protein (DUF1800 family)
MIQEMGQFPYQNPEPTGYPDRGDHWMNDAAVLSRMNFAVALSENQVLGITADLRGLASTQTEALKAVLAPTALKTQPTAQLNPETASSFALALGSPQFQHK